MHQPCTNPRGIGLERGCAGLCGGERWGANIYFYVHQDLGKTLGGRHQRSWVHLESWRALRPPSRHQSALGAGCIGVHWLSRHLGAGCTILLIWHLRAPKEWGAGSAPKTWARRRIGAAPRRLAEDGPGFGQVKGNCAPSRHMRGACAKFTARWVQYSLRVGVCKLFLMRAHAGGGSLHFL